MLAAIALLCIAVGAGAAGALNMWYDADIDALHAAHRQPADPARPHRARRGAGLRRGAGIGSVAALGLLVNWVAAGLLAFTIAFYLFVYTMWLKRRTPQNIVIGGAAGAFPPMIGWAAVTGTVSLESIVLFLIIFMWTPPHFWALALYRARDYERAGVPMLPVVAGPDETRKQIVIYTALLVPLGPAGRPSRPRRPALRADRDRLGGVFLALALASAGRAKAARPTAPRGSCSASRSSICSGCSPRCWSSGGSDSWAD